VVDPKRHAYFRDYIRAGILPVNAAKNAGKSAKTALEAMLAASESGGYKSGSSVGV
jgi:hypothetical protein